MSYKKVALRNFAKFTIKHQCWSYFFNEVADLRSAIYQKRSLAQVFQCKFCKISQRIFLQITSVFRIQQNIYDGAFLQKQLTTFSLSLLLQKASSQMFDWILNNPLQNNSGHLLLFNLLSAVLPSYRNQSIDLL